MIVFQLLGTNHITPHKIYSAMLMQWGQFIGDFKRISFQMRMLAIKICNLRKKKFRS